MKTGLLFGSFNPVHAGHLHIARQILNSEDIGEIWFVVSPQNPFKQDQGLLPVEDRLAILHRVLDNEPGLRICEVELDMPKRSYTVDTLRRLHADHPDRSFVLIIDSDNLPALHRWKDYETLLQLAAVWIYHRPGYAIVQRDLPPGAHVCEGVETDVSSTRIREALHTGKSVGSDLPPGLESWIRNKGYYAGTA